VLMEQVPPEVRFWAQVLSLTRHPMDIHSLVRFGQWFYGATAVDPRQALNHPLLRPMLKKMFPPQLVLESIRQRLHRQHPLDPWFEMYRDVRQAIAAHMDDDDRQRLHRQ